jgi:hypothetical protein
MHTRFTVVATLIVAGVLSAGVPAFDVVAAGQRGGDGETTRHSVDSARAKAPTEAAKRGDPSPTGRNGVPVQRPFHRGSVMKAPC